MHVEKSLEVVHPDLGHPGGVDAVTVVGDVVRMERSEDVADMTAGMDLHAAATPPHPEGELQVLAAPAEHSLVVAADLPEEISLKFL